MGIKTTNVSRLFQSRGITKIKRVIQYCYGPGRGYKRTEHHGFSIGIYLQEQRIVTRT